MKFTNKNPRPDGRGHPKESWAADSPVPSGRGFLLCAIPFFATALLAQTTRSVWDGVYTPDQSKRGEAAYAKSCASCHGSALTGGESAPPLAGGDFLSNWNGLTVGDLYDRFRTTMPADRPGALKRDEYADILAYVLSMNQFPAGKTELERQTEVLKQIRIEPKP
jgi:mono/diheme cytochrome c family protein